MPDRRYFASAAKGITALLVDELRALGATELREVTAGALFNGTLESGYRACLWSRLASRILLHLARFPAPTPEVLYEGVQAIAWDEHLRPEGTLAVDCNVRRSGITHTQFAAQRVKDAIVDQFRARQHTRPSVDLDDPDLRISVFIDRDAADVYIDLSGGSLHRRGYRDESMVAPMKQNLAAAILLRAGWPAIAQAGGAFVDPMCGSGTLLIEAATIAADIAPSLHRERFGFERWLGHERGCWQRLLEEAASRAAEGRPRLPPIFGCDADARAVKAARENIKHAGLYPPLRVEQRDIDAFSVPADMPPGLLVVNPPYGERLGNAEALQQVYAAIGQALRTRFIGWEAAVFTGNPPLGKHLGMNARRSHTFYNGAIECRLLRFSIAAQTTRPGIEQPGVQAEKPLSEGAQMFANRLRKNLQGLRRWAEQEGIACYRLYDADMPEYAAAIDLYRSERLYVIVQEYAAPKSIDANKARQRLRDMLHAIPPTLAVSREQVILKRRERQRGAAQYGKLAQSGEYHEVREGRCRFLVNFTDYLDTGLFLDHRLTRARIGELATGRDMLNLFCYTATASVYAALGGARATTSVDMSATYIDWARRNFALNGLDLRRHALVQADCLQWLAAQSTARPASRYDLIFLDPPTFSNSKRMPSTFDVRRDHGPLLRQAAALLRPDGLLVFSTNRQKFRLDGEALTGLNAEDITTQTLPRDFARSPRIHRCWQIRHG